MSWLSPNPAKRWNEWFVLAYTPVWIAAMGVVVVTKCFVRWGDTGHLLLGAGLALPLWLGPILLPAPVERDRPLLERHATRFAVWIAVVTFLQTYFGSIFFFDFLGMEYHFPVTLELHRTPVFLYLVTIAYFSTYYVALTVVLRRLARRFPTAPPVVTLLLRALVCYAVAFAETFSMASDQLAPYFLYRDRSFTLFFGSICYGAVFFVTLPLIARLDEDAPAPGTTDELPRPPLRRLAWDALAANLLCLLIYEGFAILIARLRFR